MANYTLKYGTPQHRTILQALRDRVKLSDQQVGNRTANFAKNEEQFRAYVPEKELDALRRTEWETKGKPKFVTINIPYSYAILMTAHTYWTSVFLSRVPVMQFQGRHGEGQMQVNAVEALMDYQIQTGGNLVPLYLWLLDVGKYGMGVVGCYWDEEYIYSSSIEEQPANYLGIPLLGKTNKVKVRRKIAGYKGNKLYNIRPQDFIFDPRVSSVRFQEGEFAGRKVDIPWNVIVRRNAEGQYQNIELLKRKIKYKASGIFEYDRDAGSSQVDLPQDYNNANLINTGDSLRPGTVPAIELCVDIIPKDWQMGSGDQPEKWVFTYVGDDMIIEARPYSYNHGKFPFHMIEYEFDAYALNKRSMLDIARPLNDTMSWLVNTHFYNVRSILNGNFIVDPYRLTVKDFKTTEGGGRMIRMKPTAYGQDVRGMFHQITTTDVTQNHMRDMQLVGELIQRSLGVTDNIMGMVNPGGRKTATEVRTSSSFGVNRLKTSAEYFSAAGFAPLAQMMLQNTQENYDMEQQFRIAGSAVMQEAMPYMAVTPEAIAGFYDFTPVDGTMPVDRFAQLNMWTNLLGQMRNFPNIMQQYDMGKIIEFVAQLGGMKNLAQFKINVIPDGQVPGGNVDVTSQGGPGAGPGAGAGGSAGPGAGVAGPIQGSGPTGGMGPMG